MFCFWFRERGEEGKSRRAFFVSLARNEVDGAGILLLRAEEDDKRV